jgi:hypothetical protein
MSGFWIVALVIGGVGGGLSAALSRHGRFLPAVVRLSPVGPRIVRVGVLGDIVMGALAAACTGWVLRASGSTLDANGRPGVLLLVLAGLFVAFLSARWVSNEVDKLVLRRAICKAVSAPAAHPDALRNIELAPPETIYAIVEDLLPRRAGHPRS